jgi:hypothetical protein
MNQLVLKNSAFENEQIILLGYDADELDQINLCVNSEIIYRGSKPELLLCGDDFWNPILDKKYKMYRDNRMMCFKNFHTNRYNFVIAKITGGKMKTFFPKDAGLTAIKNCDGIYYLIIKKGYQKQNK